MRRGRVDARVPERYTELRGHALLELGQQAAVERQERGVSVDPAPDIEVALDELVPRALHRHPVRRSEPVYDRDEL